MPFFLSPIANVQIFDSAGDPLVGGQVETYLAGSSTQAATYTSDTGLVQNSNPIILNALGYAPNAVWLSSGVAYKFIIKDANGAVLRTIDNVAGINDASVSQSQWVQSGLTPTYISATSFSLVGDQTAVFHVGRRLQTLNTAGLVYSTIATSTFGSGVTTITVLNDSSTLDLGLSQVAYGLISADNSSFPGLLLGPANTIALTNDGTTNSVHYLTFADGTAGQENLKTDTAKLAYNPSTGELYNPATGNSAGKAASQTVAGIVELATTAEAQAGIDTTRALTPARLKDAQIQNATPVSASGAAVDFTGIPSWAKRVLMVVQAGSFSGAGSLRMQLGTSGGVIASGYSGSHTLVTNSVLTAFAGNGFEIGAASAGNVFTGILQIVRIAGDVWVGNGVFSLGDTPCTMTTSGYVSLPGTLDRVRFTSTSGVNFDSGVVNVFWE